jgi:hypothetical protein
VYSLDSNSFHHLNNTIELQGVSSVTNMSVPLPYFLWNRKFYIGFYWENDNSVGNNPPFAIDDVVITGRTRMIAQVQTAQNSATGFDEKPVGPGQTVDFYDRVTGDVMLSIQNTSPYHLGCVKVEIDRAGNNAQWVTGDPQTIPQTKLADKTFRITPEFNNTSAAYNVTFYLTQAEVNGWMTNSMNALGNLRIIKYNGAISTMNYSDYFEKATPSSINTYLGSDRAITASFNTGFSGFGFGNLPLNTLPVQLLSFTGTERSRTVELKWIVENETDLRHYKVMRSTDGIRFEELGTVLPRGANGARTEYRFTDIRPESGKNYYQLVSYDLDGAFKKSVIVEVTIKDDILYTVLPNPFKDVITIRTNENRPQNVTITLTDIGGRLLMNRTISSVTSSITLPTPGLKPGLYLLQVSDRERSNYFKLVKE